MRPGLPKGKYLGPNNPKWKGGAAGKLLRQRQRNQLHAFSCLDCTAPFKGKEGCNSKYCEGCRSIVCMCSLCLKDFDVSRKDFNDGRGLFCSLNCYRLSLKLNPPYVGKKSYKWQGGINYVIARRARIRGAEGSHTKKDWEKLKDFYNHMCLCCKQQEPFIKLTEDHIVPLIMGGSNDISNIQPLCMPCNSRKHAKIIDYTKSYA